jgi:hypothetical protein
MSSGADGKWSPQFRRALVEYKGQAGLNTEDALDEATEQSLFADGAPRAARQLKRAQKSQFDGLLDCIHIESLNNPIADA